MKEALLNIERRIPVEIKNNFLRRMTGARYNITEFSNQLKQLVNNNSEIKEVLFKNNENAIHYSGDILSNTMFDYWATGRCIEEVFVERAKHTYEYANVEYEW
jgi:hypothetical protein